MLRACGWRNLMREILTNLKYFAKSSIFFPTITLLVFLQAFFQLHDCGVGQWISKHYNATFVGCLGEQPTTSSAIFLSLFPWSSLFTCRFFQHACCNRPAIFYKCTKAFHTIECMSIGKQTSNKERIYIYTDCKNLYINKVSANHS